MKKTKRVLVTGHKGFIGKNMVEYLSYRGVEALGLEKGDVFTPEKLDGIDAVIHLGAVSSTTEQNEELLLETNIFLPVRICRECKERGILFQYASSASVYGDSIETKETGRYKPKNKYGLSKYMFDQIRLRGERNGWQGFRYFNCYGNYEEHKGDQASPVSKFKWQAERDGVIRVFENSDSYRRDFVCVEDICRLHWEFLIRPDLCGIWNAGTGNPVSFLAVANAIAQKYGVGIEEVPMPENLVAGYQKYTKADLTKLEATIPGFKWKGVLDWISYNYV